jgi:flagellar motor switch/type III secretory pathway protein FliN
MPDGGAVPITSGFRLLASCWAMALKRELFRRTLSDLGKVCGHVRPIPVREARRRLAGAWISRNMAAIGPETATAIPPNAGVSPHRIVEDVEALPNYSRSLLKIKVPVMVTLANKKQPISKIVELVPGSIIQFNKSCDEMLELEVGGQPIAHGECVKVGDKFGLRLTSLTMPDERFQPVAGK